MEKQLPHVSSFKPASGQLQLSLKITTYSSWREGRVREDFYEDL